MELRPKSNGSTLGELIEAANHWCQENQITPLHGAAGVQINVRNARYYQSLGLVDRTESGPHGYGEKHLLQLIAIRVLQARGLSLSKIQGLLYGRQLEELREIQRRAKEEVQTQQLSQRPTGNWQLHNIHDGLLLLTRETIPLSHSQRAQIAAIVSQAIKEMAIEPSEKQNPPEKEPRYEQ